MTHTGIAGQMKPVAIGSIENYTPPQQVGPLSYAYHEGNADLSGVGGEQCELLRAWPGLFVFRFPEDEA